jgi:ABC-type multidrug transport system ATPase subunit
MSAAPNSGPTPAKIAVRNVTKSFGHKHVLRGADLLVPKGQSTVIIGGSGTGKSVLLKCILGLIQPDAGSDRHDQRNRPGHPASRLTSSLCIAAISDLLDGEYRSQKTRTKPVQVHSDRGGLR